MVSMTIPDTRPDDVPTDRTRVEEALRLLSGVPVGLDVAVKRLSRGSGVYAWWAAPSIFPDLPGSPNGSVPSLRLLYLGRATSLRGRILRLGTVPHAELPRYHAVADVAVSPATGQESFGIVLVEAMAAGVPVVASDIAGYREVVRDGVDGLLVPPNDANALAAAIRRVLSEPELAATLAAAGRTRAETFSWRTVAPRLEAVYDRVIGATR